MLIGQLMLFYAYLDILYYFRNTSTWKHFYTCVTFGNQIVPNDWRSFYNEKNNIRSYRLVILEIIQKYKAKSIACSQPYFPSLLLIH